MKPVNRLEYFIVNSSSAWLLLLGGNVLCVKNRSGDKVFIILTILLTITSIFYHGVENCEHFSSEVQLLSNNLDTLIIILTSIYYVTQNIPLLIFIFVLFLLMNHESKQLMKYIIYLISFCIFFRDTINNRMNCRNTIIVLLLICASHLVFLLYGGCLDKLYLKYIWHVGGVIYIYIAALNLAERKILQA